MDSIYKIGRNPCDVIGAGAYNTQAAELARRWQDTINNATFKGANPEFWDSWAKTLPVKTGSSGYVQEVMARMNLNKEDSVLDIGAGTGALAIPLAQKVTSVTVLDQSQNMLALIMEKAAGLQLANIKTVNASWEEVRVGKDVAMHDVVLVSRSLPSQGDIISTLERINQAARRSCYITWKADSYDVLEAEICAALGIEYRHFPDYFLLYNILYNMGIRANVEIFTMTSERVYHDINDAFVQIIRSHQFETSVREELARKLLEEKLEFYDGFYRQKKGNLWALIHWHKA
ncbi:MAG: class I SAM-dependent methyltransferase [Dehalococcoidales bacterium]|nr:class I SAM-dependent methyltransferase [Dehalococcoidales bacterium]